MASVITDGIADHELDEIINAALSLKRRRLDISGEVYDGDVTTSLQTPTHFAAAGWESIPPDTLLSTDFSCCKWRSSITSA
jgi:hypothetical protein